MTASPLTSSTPTALPATLRRLLLLTRPSRITPMSLHCRRHWDCTPSPPSRSPPRPRRPLAPPASHSQTTWMAACCLPLTTISTTCCCPTSTCTRSTVRQQSLRLLHSTVPSCPLRAVTVAAVSLPTLTLAATRSRPNVQPLAPYATLHSTPPITVKREQSPNLLTYSHQQPHSAAYPLSQSLHAVPLSRFPLPADSLHASRSSPSAHSRSIDEYLAMHVQQQQQAMAIAGRRRRRLSRLLSTYRPEVILACQCGCIAVVHLPIALPSISDRILPASISLASHSDCQPLPRHLCHLVFCCVRVGCVRAAVVVWLQLSSASSHSERRYPSTDPHRAVVSTASPFSGVLRPLSPVRSVVSGVVAAIFFPVSVSRAPAIEGRPTCICCILSANAHAVHLTSHVHSHHLPPPRSLSLFCGSSRLSCTLIHLRSSCCHWRIRVSLPA